MLHTRTFKKSRCQRHSQLSYSQGYFDTKDGGGQRAWIKPGTSGMKKGMGNMKIGKEKEEEIMQTAKGYGGSIEA